ncbi:ATP-binding protein [Selenomonas sp. AB3002]|uniref:HD domain-containing protein n=1 Tax=Selenomonas sp. AB3002 TaxID=1392502 RepID=UPI000495DE6D
MYLEDRLEFLSQTNPDVQDKVNQWNVIKMVTAKKLETVCVHFPHFSKHDISHSRKIGEHISKLLGVERIEKLSCSDLMMMLSSFYLHDIGMALKYEEIYFKLISEEFQRYLNDLANDSESELQHIARRLCNFTINDNDYEHSIEVYNDVIEVIEHVYRSGHAERSAGYIISNEAIKHCFGIRNQKLLASICKQHQKSIKHIMDIPHKENGIFDDYMHPRFIVAMLCLGDLLDLDTDRFNEYSLESSTPMPHLSKLHLKKHESVERFLIDYNEIYIKSNVENDEVYRIMRQWMDWIQNTCEYIALHWSEIAPENFGNSPRLVQREIMFKGSNKWAELANLNYHISSKRMFQLFAGGGIYRNKLVCIREIIQNAVDATIFRLYDEKILDGTPEDIIKKLKDNYIDWKAYQIKGYVKEIDNTHVEICIRDNGIGISVEDIHRIAEVSNKRSAYSRNLLRKMPDWMRPSGAFGMGMQSIFLLVDQFVIVTKTINEAPKKLTFQNATRDAGYIIVEEYKERFAQGTEVKLIVDLTKLNADELGCPNYYYCHKILSPWFLRKLRAEYGDLHPSQHMRGLEMKKKKWDVVPIDISITDHRNGEDIPLLNIPPFFSNGLKEVDIKNGCVKTSVFFPALNCHLMCKILLQNEVDRKHQYGTINDSIELPYNVIFYRHSHVCDWMFGQQNNIPFLPYVTWCIDLMGENADKVVNINRNTIREEYCGYIWRILLTSLEETAKLLIDYLLDDKIGRNERPQIKDTILLVYQFAKQYSYKSDELWHEYKDLLKDISIGNYYSFESEEEIYVKCCDLRNQKVFFVSEKLDEINLPNKLVSKIEKYSSNSMRVFNLNGALKNHILNHRAEKIIVAKVDEEFVELVQTEPFSYADVLKNAPKIDDLVLLKQTLRMLLREMRGLPVFNGYEILATPVDRESPSFNSYISEISYLIESPFVDYVDVFCDIINKNYFINNAMDEYYQKIIDSDGFKHNLKYILVCHNNEKNKVEKAYKNLVEKILRLLSSEEYIELNKFYVRKYINPDVDGYIYNVRDILEDNRYLSTFSFKYAHKKHNPK